MWPSNHWPSIHRWAKNVLKLESNVGWPNDMCISRTIVKRKKKSETIRSFSNLLSVGLPMTNGKHEQSASLLQCFEVSIHSASHSALDSLTLPNNPTAKCLFTFSNCCSAFDTPQHMLESIWTCSLSITLLSHFLNALTIFMMCNLYGMYFEFLLKSTQYRCEMWTNVQIFAHLHLLGDS